ncbi:site-specific integrase [Leptospira yasudae]|nr:site-specific integrase [Leptospira yasudae]
MSIRSNVVNLAEFRNARTGPPKGSSPESGLMLGKGLTDQTMIDLIKKFSDPISERDYRNRALLNLMYLTALRAKEIVSLRFSDLFLAPSGETLISYTKKGGKMAFAVIAEETLNFIREYHSRFEGNHDHFFLSLPRGNQKERSNITTRGLQLIVNSWNVRTCSKKLIHPHSLRHTAASKLMDLAGSGAVQKLLNHASPNTSLLFYTKPYFNASKFLKWE